MLATPSLFSILAMMRMSRLPSRASSSLTKLMSAAVRVKEAATKSKSFSTAKRRSARSRLLMKGMES